VKLLIIDNYNSWIIEKESFPADLEATLEDAPEVNNKEVLLNPFLEQEMK